MARVANKMNNGIVHFNVDYDDKRKLLICMDNVVIFQRLFIHPSEHWFLLRIYTYISIVWKPSVHFNKGTMNKQLNRREKKNV